MHKDSNYAFHQTVPWASALYHSLGPIKAFKWIWQTETKKKPIVCMCVSPNHCFTISVGVCLCPCNIAVQQQKRLISTRFKRKQVGSFHQMCVCVQTHLCVCVSILSQLIKLKKKNQQIFLRNKEKTKGNKKLSYHKSNCNKWFSFTKMV